MADLPGFAKPIQVAVSIAVPRDPGGQYAPFDENELRLLMLQHDALSSEDTHIEVSLSARDYDPDEWTPEPDPPDTP